MRAIVHDRYGAPDVLRLADVERPTPKEGEVLVKVHATTVNRTDMGFMRGAPFIVRFFSGVVRPKNRILGGEFAGEVVGVGPGVTDFDVGDRVFGVNPRFSAHAEYTCMRARDGVTTMPVGVSYEEAAAVCDGIVLARTCLDGAKVGPGTKLMVYGASGSIGSAAVQIAKHYGADVTAVCDTKHVDIVRSLGANRVIDYTAEDFTKIGDTFDVMFDAVGKTSFMRTRGLLNPRGGAYVATEFGPWHQHPFIAGVTRWFNGRRVRFPIPRYSKEHMVFAKDLLEAGEYRPVIDRCYPLEQVPDAAQYVETGQKTGNVVITVAA